MSLTSYVVNAIIARVMTMPRGGFEWDDVEATPVSEDLPPASTKRAVRVPPVTESPPLVRARSTPRMPLRAMRGEVDKTQAEVAAALGTEQGEVSRIERREDVRLSTLRRYAAAIGAECEVVFVFPRTGRRVILEDPLTRER